MTAGSQIDIDKINEGLPPEDQQANIDLMKALDDYGKLIVEERKVQEQIRQVIERELEDCWLPE